MASRLERLPPELRQAIFSLVIWTPTPPPDFHEATPLDRIRLRDDWDIWIEPSTRPPAGLALLLTCRTTHHDVRRLTSYGARTPVYELDLVFIAGCGLFPTWTLCPLPSQTHIHALNATIRMLNAQDIDTSSDPSHSYFDPPGPFATRYAGCASSFDPRETHSSTPPAARNFYHLLVRFLALGPLGVVSGRGSFARSSPPRYTLDRRM